MAAFDREIEVAAALARRAGDEALEARREGRIRPGEKAGGEVVTAADLRADEIIGAGLKAQFPADALWSEETPGRPEATEGRMWVVDPLDGTGDFVAGGDAFSVSIGLAVDGAPVLGVVYNPARGELVAGVVGAGVELNGARAHAGAGTRASGARLSCSPREEATVAAAVKATGADFVVEPIASMAYKLARVAVALDDATLSLRGRKPWGLCAGVALARAGGAAVALLGGGEIAIDPRHDRQPDGMLAAPDRLVAPLLGVARHTRPAA
jgi:myo-inositol-1(or 4)-monophosphatase